MADESIQETAGKLSNKVALITGAASGIGRETALLFARQGAAVAVVDTNAEAGDSVVREIREREMRALFIRCDVSRSAECRKAVRNTVDSWGRLDLLVNNAGIIRRASVVELPECEWDRVIEVNLKSVYLFSKFAIPVMVRQGGGAIINVASGWGLAGGPRAASYCAAKGGVVLLTKAMAIDHGPQNIRINCICPGDTDTPLLRQEAEQLGEPLDEFLERASRHRPLGRIGKPVDVARAALYLAGEDSAYVTGATLVVDGGGLAGS